MDFSCPIIRLETLTIEEIYLLLEKLMDVYCTHHKLAPILTQSQLVAFMQMVSNRIGAEKLLTPREVTRDFLSLLSLLHQNPGETFESLTQTGQVQLKSADADPDDLNDDAFAVFDL